MIYPIETGKTDKDEIRLRTLESVWIQGKLKMWGRWSVYSDMPEAVSMFKRLLSRNAISREDMAAAIGQLRRAGCNSPELDRWFSEMLADSMKSSLIFCTDDEGVLMDRVVSSTMKNHPHLLSILKLRYQAGGKSKRQIAETINSGNPGVSFKTCQRRVDAWLSVAESMLYLPMCDALNLNAGRFYC